ncbi:MAG: hypothetical protein JJ921_02240 [Pseudomonadales bacterium]|nr:hypothetical protein [Pseudomonadales bacterium]MBO7005023.1 hypothetical protein [Pseudomonadales bacterium]
MPKVSETIPGELQPRVDAALAWFNASENAENEAFKVTGIVDAEDALRGSDELRLIMCGGDRCEQRSFRVVGTNNAWEVELADDVLAAQGDKPQAELDPPPGVRSSWLDKALSQHAFVVLLFYRGFW